jgi:hypothetical protein
MVDRRHTRGADLLENAFNYLRLTEAPGAKVGAVTEHGETGDLS